MGRRSLTRVLFAVAAVIVGVSGSGGFVPRARAATATGATINTHTVMVDSSGNIVSWVPQQDQAYAQVVANAWDYLLNKVPVDPANGKPDYYSYSYLNPDTQQAVGWPHNPAGLFSMLIESAIEYYQYSGDGRVLQFAQNLADFDIAHGMTPAGYAWPNVPYASSDPGALTYQGAAQGNSNGVGDGAGVIEPDKVGELGHGLAGLYKQTGNTSYLSAAINAANALAANIRPGNATQSPWPFRVYAQNNTIREQYTAHVISPIELFDDLIALNAGNVSAYQSARTAAWNWLMTYPMQNNNWSGYFEDVAIQTDPAANPNQLNAMMTARYLLQHPQTDPNWQTHVRGLIAWVEQTFGTMQYGAQTIKEQAAFMYPMGSHTSRYASVNALLYQMTGDLAAKQKAYYAFNWATYMARSNGVDIDGPQVNNQWFTDGYGDFIRNFMVGMGGAPDFAPNGQTHLLQTSSIVTKIDYSNPNSLTYQTFDASGTETVKATSQPTGITLNGRLLAQRTDLNAEGWTYDTATNTVRIRRSAGTNVVITLSGSPTNQPPVVNLTAPANNARFAPPASFTLNATASDPDDSISKVEFYQNNTLLGTSSTAPYSYQVQNLPVGIFTFTAKAYDSRGAVTISSPITVTVSSLPAGWNNNDIGTVGVAGSANYANSTYTVQGSGMDIWGNADSFNFTSTTLNGDGQITARVASQQNTDPWALAGVMMRDTSDPASKEVLAALTPGNGFSFDYRDTSGGATTYISGGPGAAPNWVRLVRAGSTFTAYQSIDGVNWTATGSATISMSTSLSLGLAVTSHNNTTLGTATFDNVSVTGAGLVISNVNAGNITPTGANVTWTTNVPATSQIEYGTSTAYGASTAVNTSLDTNHSQVMTGLQSSTAYHYRVRSTDGAGNSIVSADNVFSTPAATSTTPPGFGIDTQTSVDGRGTVTTPAFSTTSANETLFAFAGSDGPMTSAQTLTVSGAGLTWRLVQRANTQAGTAEIWAATTSGLLTNATVSSTQSNTGYDQSLTVVAVKGTAGVGASASANAATGAPSANLTTTKAGSLIFGVGSDWDSATSRTLLSGQTLQHQWVDTPAGDTFWTQSLSAPTGAAGSATTIGDSAPTNDRWNFAAVEIVPN